MLLGDLILFILAFFILRFIYGLYKSQGQNLKIPSLPIYAQLKAKLESKGLDSITSGQIAWFVCSLGCLFFVPFIYQDQYTFLFATFFTYVINLIYIYNIIPLSLVVVFALIWMKTSYYFSDVIYILGVICLVLMLICFILKKWRFIVTFCFGWAFWAISLRVFYLLGGFYK